MIYKSNNNLYIKLFEATDAKSGDPIIVYQEMFGGYKVYVEKKKDFNFSLVENITQEMTEAIKGLSQNPVSSTLEIN